MSCLDNIIGVDRKCSEPPLSGLYLFDAPEISTLNLAKIANEDYVNGITLAKAKIELTKTLLYNDFMSVMASSDFMPNISEVIYSSGDFNINVSFPADGLEKGIVLHRSGPQRTNSIRKQVIGNVFIYPLSDLDNVELKVYEDYNGGIVSTYDIVLVANQVNVFPINHTVKGTYARVVIKGDVALAGSNLTCFTGCNGRTPNDCGNVKGIYNGKELSSKEGFGINIDFKCECDYEAFLCSIAKTYLGEIFWLKARVMVMEEFIRSNRLNNLIVYGNEQAKEYLVDLENQYREKWNLFVKGLPNMVKNAKEPLCFDCKNFRWVTNI